MKGSDLPDDLKNEVLKRIEQQVGSTQYNKMVSSIGEDKLIEVAFEQAQQSASTATQRETRGFWEKYGWWVAGICYLFSLSPQWIGFQIIAIILSIIIIVMWFNDRGIGLGKLLGSLLGYLFIYALGLSLLDGVDGAWKYILALPAGIFWLWLMTR